MKSAIGVAKRRDPPAAAPEVQRYLDAHARLFARGAGPAWLAARRREAVERFAECGFPTTRDEDWKYTNVAPLLRTPFAPASGPFELDRGAVARMGVVAAAGGRALFVNGFLASPASAPPGVRVAGLDDALRADPGFVERHLARNEEPSGFAALNRAFLRDAAVVHVGAGRTLRQPIELVFASQATAAPLLAQPRALVVLDAGSEATLVEIHAAADGMSSLENAVVEVVLAESARLEHVKVIRGGDGAHVALTSVAAGRGASYASCVVVLGGRFVRNDLHVRLGGEGAECRLDGLYVAGGETFVDNHTAIDHARPHGTSRELYKGILDGRARAVFNGRVVVREDAQKTDARQTNKNLLLSERAEIDTKPELQILANDVQCSHGAAIGQLDDEQVFYLRSRGLSHERARRVLTWGFAVDVVRRIGSEAVRVEVERLVAARLEVEPSEVVE